MTLEEMVKARLEEVRAELVVLVELQAEERRLENFLGLHTNKKGIGTGLRARLRAELSAAGTEGCSLSELNNGAATASREYNIVSVALYQLKRKGEATNRNGRWYAEGSAE